MEIDHDTRNKVQTRSNDGGLAYFDTLKEALNYANVNNVKIEEKLRAEKTPTNGELASMIYKISFSLGNGEQVRLVYEGGNWVLRQMADILLRDELSMRVPPSGIEPESSR